MKIINNIFVLLIATILINACGVGKKYSRAELNLPDNYRTEATSDTVQLPWKTFFKDPILIGLIEQSLEKNNTIVAAMKSVEQTELMYKQAKLQFLPTVDFSTGGNRNWLSRNSLNGSLSEQFIGTTYMDDYNAGFNLSWEIDIWRKAKMQKEDALAVFFSQQENINALRTRIITEVASAYYNLIALDEQLRIAERNTALSDSTLRMITLQYNSAEVSSLALEQAAAQKKTAELLIPLAKQNIAIQENALSILCGNYPSFIERTGSLEQAIPKELFPTGVPAWLLSRRPDVKMAEYAVMSANAKTGLAKANMYPTFSLSASFGTNSFNFNNWFNLPGSLAKNLGLNLVQPVFRRKFLKTAYDIAVIEQEKSVLQFKETVLIAVREVSDALVTLKYTDERLILVEEKTKSLNKATNDAVLLYRSAMANYLEVVTAQNNSLQNELEAITIKRDKLIALTTLYRSLGGIEF